MGKKKGKGQQQDGGGDKSSGAGGSGAGAGGGGGGGGGGDGKQPQPGPSDQQKKQQQKQQQQSKGDQQQGASQQRQPQQQQQAWQQKGPQQGGDTPSGQQRGPQQGAPQQQQPQQQKQRGPQKGAPQQQQPQQQAWQQRGPQQGAPQQQQPQQQKQRGPQQGAPQQQQPQQQAWQQRGPQQGAPQQQQRQQQAWQQRGPQQGTPQQQQPQQQKQRGPQQGVPQQQQPQQQAWQQRGPQQGGGAPPGFQGPPPGQQRGGPQQSDSQKGRQQKDKRPEKPPSEAKSPPPSTPSKSSSSQSLASAMSAATIQSAHIRLDRGTRGRKVVIETNYLQLFINKIIDSAYQYDIKFDPDKPKRFYRQAFEEFRVQNIPRIFLAFDGKAIVYSPVKLAPEVVSKTFEVKVVETEGGSEKIFKVTLKETQDPIIDLSSLKNYQSLRIFDKPMRAIQCLDIVLRSPCYSRSVQAGRAFYVPPKEYKDLRDGYELWYGLFQAAVLGETPLLNIDVCHKSFPSAKNIIDIIQSLRGANLNQELNEYNYRDLRTFLKGLIIVYKPPIGNPRRYKFNDLKDSVERQTFTDESGKKMTVLQYFMSKNYRIRFPKMPCLHVGNPVRCIYLPAEYCEIAQGQVSLKKAGTNQVREIIRYAAVSTFERKAKTLECYNPFQHNSDPTIRTFGVQIDDKFLDVDARIIDAPRLQYGSNRMIEPFKGSWKAENVPYIQPTNLIKWAILLTDRRQNDFNARKLGDMVIKLGRNMNMQINDKYDVLKEFDSRRLDAQFNQIKSNGYQLCFVIISPFGDSYAQVKQGAEIKSGVLTQCMKSDTLEKRLNPSTVSNILLKVNAKLSGINHKISDNDKTDIMKESVMFLGADVTHPSPDQRQIPSVVGVAASHDDYGFQYNMRWRLQDPKKEIIQDMENILKEQLEFYKRQRGKYPQKIMYYRDGVSEGQFEQVRRTELLAMDRACRNIKPQPKITCIVVQKRHHTRFFPKQGSRIINERDRFKNVPPGTIVDTKITHPNESQFFLVSHESIQGTAKPTKYCIIRDDSDFNIDDLQAITYNLCHLFARCNRTVSYPAPAYNAHLAAYRGRVYIEQRNPLNMNNLDREYTNRQVKPEIYIDSPMYFV